MRLYFVLRPQVVPRQRLAQVVWLFFAVQLSVIQPLFYSPSLSSSSRIFRSRFSSFPIRFRLCRFSLLLFFYFSSSLQLFGLFFIHNNTVKSCFQGYVLSSPKILSFFLEKQSCKYRFRFVFAMISVSVADYLPGPKFRCRAHEDRG